jgi:hypothetical protein
MAFAGDGDPLHRWLNSGTTGWAVAREPIIMRKPKQQVVTRAWALQSILKNCPWLCMGFASSPSRK